MPGMSAYDRWLTTPPEDQWQPSEDEFVPDDMPDPCPACDGVGGHGEGCRFDTTNPFAGAKFSVESKSGSVIPDAGGYDVFAIMDDGDVLCRVCVVDPTNPVHDERNPTMPCPADTDGDGDCAFCARSKTPGRHPRPVERDGWGVIAFDHTGNLEESEHCSHCGKEIR